MCGEFLACVSVSLANWTLFFRESSIDECILRMNEQNRKLSTYIRKSSFEILDMLL